MKGNANSVNVFLYTETKWTVFLFLRNHTPPVGSIDSTSGNRQILVTARLYSLLAVLTVTTLTTLSSPGCVAVMRPNFHCWGGTFSSRSNTNAPTLMSNTPSFHFWRVYSV